MSYLVLARKWRPKTFSDTVGQEHVLKALVNALESGRLHHAYLFAGTRGVGKTTIARILAKALNCETGVTAEPCGACSSCREIDEGRFVDLIEVDAASRTKVDDTRDLLENVQYAPSRGRYKVYLIDEVHMLSKHSFNALLKTLEEPPPHVKFLFATTDPDKLPVTVLSRCLQFNLTRLTPRLIQERLAHICRAEDIDAEASALTLLARAADGSLRDALSLLDQAIAHCGGSVDVESVAGMLGSIDRAHVTRLLRLLADGDPSGIIDALAIIDTQFPDYARLLEDLARALQRIAVYQVVGRIDADDEVDEDEIAAFAEAMSAADVQLFYQIALIGRRDLYLAPDPKSGAQMTLLRMIAFRPAAAAEPRAAGPAGGKPRKSSARAQRGSAAQEREARPAAASAAGTDDLQDADWPALIASLSMTGAAKLLAGNCVFESYADNRLSLTLDPRSESLLTRQRQNAIATALTEHIGRPIEVRIRIGAAAAETPVQEEARLSAERLDAARRSLEADPTVQALKSMFGAELKADSIAVNKSSQNDQTGSGT